MRLIILAVLLIGSLSLTDSTILQGKGAGITDEQVKAINVIIEANRQYYFNWLGGFANKIRSEVEKLYGQFWVIEIAQGFDVNYGISGAKYANDQWLTLVKEGGYIFYWIYVPAVNQIQVKKPTSLLSIINGKQLLKRGNFDNRGEGINDTQEKAILHIMKNAELAKGDIPQDCSVYVKEKLEDSFGQNWIVEIIGGKKLNWGRSQLIFKREQWVFYTDHGDYSWQYLIWVPGF